MKYCLSFLFLFVSSLMLNAQTPVLGTTEGVFNVSDLGSATYTIPLKVPDGIAGIQPNLTLIYNSQGGNGIMGMGWSLSGGISAITRTPQTIYNDKKVTGISLTAEDRFALDGQRLTVTNGSGYGTPNSIYRTEVESFKETKAIGTLGTGPMSFEVTDLQTGIKYVYGTQSISRPTIPGKVEPYMWLLDKVTDLNGNYMYFTYEYNSGEEPRLTRIDYTGNTNTATERKSVVIFGYHSRPDPNFSYVAGGKIDQKYRLGTIFMVQHDAILAPFAVRSYHLAYETDQYTHLVRVYERGHELNGPPEQLQPTEFTYGTPAPNTSTGVLPILQSNETNRTFVEGDFNGDGISDIINHSTLNGGTFRLYLKNNNNSWSLSQSGTLANGFTNMYNENLLEMHQTRGVMFDYNGDGKSDFAYFQNYQPTPGVLQQKYWVYLSNGTSISNLGPIVLHDNLASQGNASTFAHTSPYTGDFDGDGKTEILLLYTRYQEEGSTYVPGGSFLLGEKYNTYTTSLNYPAYKVKALGDNIGFNGRYVNAPDNSVNKQTVAVIDYNGDGRSDILSVVNGVASVYELNVTFDANNNPVIGTPVFKLINTAGYPSAYHKIYTGDFNGDKITDVLTWYQSVGWRIGYGKGNGVMIDEQQGPSMSPPGDGLEARPMFIADFNGDGKDDIFDHSFYNNSSPKIYYSIGNNNFLTETTNLNTSDISLYAATYWLGDFNGDGAADIINRKIYTANPLEASFHPSETRHMVEQIKNGFGASTKLMYMPLTAQYVAAPANGTTVSYPFVRKTLPMKVVYNANSDNGVNTTGNDTRYSYGGFKYNVHGKGIIGFDKVISYDVVKNITMEKVYALNTTYAFQWQQTTLMTQGQQPLSTATTNQSVYDYGLKRFLPYTTQTTSNDYIKNTAVTENYTYNWSGNPSTAAGSDLTGKPVSVSTNEGNGLEIAAQTFTFPPATGNPSWLFMKPKSITSTATRLGQPSYTRSQDMTYSAANGLLQSTVNDPGTSHAITSTKTYNAYGNLIQSTVSAAGIAPRTEIFQYDLTNRFVIKSYNADYPDIQTNTTYDILTGTVSSIKRPDGLIQNFTYDGFGRAKVITDGNGKSITSNYLPASGHTLAPATGLAQYAVQTISNSDGESYTFYDRLGRVARTAKLGINGQWIFVDDRYNNKGQLVRRSIPYFQGGIGYNNTWNYDDAGRVITQFTPSGDNTTFTYAVTSNGASITATNAAGQSKKTFTDKSGVLIRSEDEGGAIDYIYHSNGKMKSSGLNNTVVQQYEYDPFGRQTKRTDPNYGSYEYTYNNLDELVSEKDPKGTIYNYTYNSLGKVIDKSGPEGTYTYVYNTANGPNCGKLVQLTGPNGTVTHNYNYGIGDKVNYEEQIIGSETFKTQYTYDNFGRVKTKVYPNNVAVEYAYNSNNGNLQSVGKQGATYPVPILGQQPAYLYSIVEENAFGQTTRAGYQSQFIGGTAGTIPYTFSSSTGYTIHGILTGQNTYKQSTNGGPAPVICNYTYTFQPTTGNLLQRKDQKYFMQEDFTYDNVNRLTNIQGQKYGSSPYMLAAQTMDYANNGNVLQKSDAGSFSYDQANRVSEIYPFVNIPTIPQEITYTPFDKVSTIEEGSNRAQFMYWANEYRAKMELLESNVLKKTKYYAGDYEKEIDAQTGQIRELCYIYGPNDNLVSIIEKKSGIESTFFVQTDHLGSITQIFDGNGNIVEEKSFDAWGRSRNPQTWVALSPTGISNGWDRGYTGHEHLYQFGIINMNGRLYDPLMGRMMEPDPFIIGSNNSQGYNRYSYALNNPLKYSDPDGHMPILAAMAVGAAVSAILYTGKVALSEDGFANWNWGQFAFSVGMGAASAAMTTGIGDAFGAVSGQFAKDFGKEVGKELLRAGLHGLNSFIASGANYRQGLAGFASSLAGVAAVNIPVLKTDIGSFAFSTTVGGATASISGGNFMEGAMTAALIHGLNQMQHNEKNGNSTNENTGEEKITLDKIKKGPPKHPEYEAPKGGDRKIKNPNGKGSGWVDRKGRVWVPTDHNGTHAPHWDRQNNDGTHENVYPNLFSPLPIGYDPMLPFRVMKTFNNVMRSVKNWWNTPSAPCGC